MKVVLDTNVIISGLLWKGNVNEIFKLYLDNKISICSNQSILEEVNKVLQYPRIKKVLDKYEQNPADIFNKFKKITRIYPEITIKNIIKEDPSDDKFIACAISSKSKIIISGDKHLLKLKKFKDIIIFTPTKFLQEINK